jgi:hypothetical protein
MDLSEKRRTELLQKIANTKGFASLTTRSPRVSCSQSPPIPDLLFVNNLVLVIRIPRTGKVAAPP